MLSRMFSSLKLRWAEICAEFSEPEDFGAPFEMAACCNSSRHLKALLREACDLLSEERDEIFTSHQIGGKLVVTDVFSANAAERIQQIDDLIKAAAVAINAPEDAV
jgi:hypothetical protein